VNLCRCGDFALPALIAELAVHAATRFDGHHLHPPLHHAVGLGEEAMAANVHAVAFVDDSAGDAADLLARLKDNGLDGRGALELDSCGQPSRTGSDDDGCALLHGFPCGSSGAPEVDRGAYSPKYQLKPPGWHERNGGEQSM
jgi:hypothetical protein